jgi:CMP-N-acetylneuraminic acid synthetase
VQRRQEYKGDFWFLDESIYGFTKKFLIKYKSFLNEEVSFPIKCSKISSWDIDTPFDLAIA